MKVSTEAAEKKLGQTLFENDLQQPNQQKPTILVVEPDPATRRLYEVVLRPVAHRVLIAENPRAARLQVFNKKIDLAVVEPQDETLEWDLLDELAARDVPVIVVTSRDEEEVRTKAERSDAAFVLTKPFESDTLLAAVSNVIATRNRQRRSTGKGNLQLVTPPTMVYVPDQEGDPHADLEDRSDLEDRLTAEPQSDTPATEAPSFDRGRMRVAAVAWMIVAIAAFGVSLSLATTVPFVPWLILATVASALNVWTTLHSDGGAYDPAFPVKVALGVAVGPVAAPLALSAQSVMAGLATGASTKADVEKTVVNIGIITLEGFSIGIGLWLLMPSTQPTGTGWLLAGAYLLAVIAGSLIINFTSVRVTLRYLAGQSVSMKSHIYQHVSDVGGGLALGMLVLVAAENGWLATVAVLAAGAIVAWRLQGIREDQNEAYERLQDYVADHEQRRAGLHDHSEQVAKLVSQLVTDRSEKEQMAATAGAWCHTLTTGGWPDRCSGGPRPDLWDQVRHLPHSWDLNNTLDTAGHRRQLLTTELTELDVPALIGIACAVDSLRLESGQLSTTQDIADAWGHPLTAVEAVAELAGRR